MDNFGFTARNVNAKTEVSNGPLVVDFNCYGVVTYSNVRRGTPQYAAAIKVFNEHVGLPGLKEQV